MSWIAAAYSEGFADLAELSPPVCRPEVEHSWHLYVVRHERADELSAALQAAGVGHKAYYRVPAHAQPAMREYAPADGLPGTAAAARTHLAIPMSPVLSREQADAVVAAVSAAL